MLKIRDNCCIVSFGFLLANINWDPVGYSDMHELTDLANTELEVVSEPAYVRGMISLIYVGYDVFS